MKTKRNFLTGTLIILIAFLVYHCANPVSPTGGPRDVTAPGVVSSTPENNSIHFDKSRITINFDEFVELDNPNQQVLISPPLREKPEYKLRGKSLIIDLNEELLPNTTYTIFFGNAIVDITEGNALANYLYAFSTGDYIDTLAIGGEVVNAFNLKPREEVFVMLFPKSNDTVPVDSIPMLTRPLYVAKTDVNGQFQLRNLQNREYTLFALSDVNSNYMFDLPNEEIAFIDSLVSPEILEPPRPDTAMINDSTLLHEDSTHVDTVIVQEMYDRYYQMFMFQQFDTIQRLLDNQVFWPPKFSLNFAFPTIEPTYTVLNQDPGDDWAIERLNKDRDTLDVWLKDVMLDSLELRIADGDSILDTLMISFTKEKEDIEMRHARKNRDNEEQKVQRITLRTNAKGSRMELGRPFRLIAGNPLQSWDFSTTMFIAGEDTTTGAPFIPADSIGMVFELDYPLEEDTRYEFVIPDSSLYNIYQLTNDSLQAVFTTAEIRDYGNLVMDIEVNEYPYIIHLLNLNDKIIKTKYISESQVVEFEYLAPGGYLVKAIQDKWPNKKWDTGIYTEKRQPEKVFYFPAELQVRANWDIQETWALP